MSQNPSATSTFNFKGSYGRDDNGVPITYLGLTANKSITLSANNTTAHVALFSVTGQVLVTSLWGVVTTALGNNTAAYWRLNDQTAQSDITLSTGTALTNAVSGAMIAKKGLAAAALTLLDATQERVSEPTTLETSYFSPFVAIQKTGGVETDIEFTYTTTDTPTSGAITFYVSYIPLTAGSRITAL